MENYDLFICIFSTFTALLLYRIVYIYFLFQTWNNDLTEYFLGCYHFGLIQGQDLDSFKLKMGFNVIYIHKWFITDFIKEKNLIKDVNNFIAKNRNENYTNWNNFH
jgi:hypothetical protein